MPVHFQGVLAFLRVMLLRHWASHFGQLLARWPTSSATHFRGYGLSNASQFLTDKTSHLRISPKNLNNLG